MFGPYKFVDKLASAINELEKSTEMKCLCSDDTLNTVGCMCNKGYHIDEVRKTIDRLLKQTKRKKGKKNGKV